MECIYVADFNICFDPLYDMGLNSFFSSAVFAGTWTIIITNLKQVRCRNLNSTWHHHYREEISILI